VVLPQSGEEGDERANERLAEVLARLDEEGLEAVGQVTHPDPYTSIHNALQYHAIDEIVISTLPGERSGWLRADLVGRVERSTAKPVEHVEVSLEQESADEPVEQAR
jgi:nucleotide-binding universal stress UspA family protein